jgi:AbrB family looped-hinge helix DNA binding protein
MQTKVSSQGVVLLPAALRRRLDIRTGDCLDANVENGRIILTPAPSGNIESSCD